MPALRHLTCRDGCVMADLTDLLRAVEERAVALVDTAADDFVGWNLDRVVPVGEPDPLGRPRVGPRLKDTYFREPTRAGGGTVSVTLGYTAPQAAYSNYLVGPHPIPLRPLSYPLRFWWGNGPNGAGEYRYMRVDHPGNINSASLGWWDKAVNDASWSLALESAGRILS